MFVKIFLDEIKIWIDKVKYIDSPVGVDLVLSIEGLKKTKGWAREKWLSAWQSLSWDIIFSCLQT